MQIVRLINHIHPSIAMDSDLSTSSDDEVLVAAAVWLLNRIRRVYLELVQLSRYDHIFSW